MFAEAGHRPAAFLHPSPETKGLWTPPKGAQETFLFPHPQSPCPRGLSQIAGGQRHLMLLQICCGSSQLNLSSSCALQSFPSPCPAMIHGSFSALPHMGTWNFTFPARGKTMLKSAFFSALPPALFVPLVPCPCWHRPSLPHSAPHTAVPWGAPVPHHPLPHRWHPQAQAQVPTPYGNPWSFPCPQITVEQGHPKELGACAAGQTVQGTHPC